MRVLRKLIVLIAAIALLAGLGYVYLMPGALPEARGTAESGAAPGMVPRIRAAVQGYFSGRPEEPREAAAPAGERPAPLRGVRFRDIVALEALLGPGEPPPEAALRDLYAQARAPARAQTECRAVLDTFGATCQVRAVEIRRLEDGRYEFDARLAVTQADPPGAPPPGDAAGLPGGEVVLGPGIEGVAPEGLPAARAVFYGRAQEACAALRDATGGCVIEAVEISLRESRVSPGGFDLDATARLGAPRPGGG